MSRAALPAPAAVMAPRGVASLHSPVASCSYHTARSAPCRSATALPRSSLAGQPPASSGNIARFSSALSGSSFLGGGSSSLQQAERLGAQQHDGHDRR